MHTSVGYCVAFWSLCAVSGLSIPPITFKIPLASYFEILHCLPTRSCSCCPAEPLEQMTTLFLLPILSPAPPPPPLLCSHTNVVFFYVWDRGPICLFISPNAHSDWAMTGPGQIQELQVQSSLSNLPPRMHISKMEKGASSDILRKSLPP